MTILRFFDMEPIQNGRNYVTRSFHTEEDRYISDDEEKDYPKVIEIPVDSECCRERCEKKATHLAYCRDPSVARVDWYCKRHAYAVDDHDGEYINKCPNCSCLHSVN